MHGEHGRQCRRNDELDLFREPPCIAARDQAGLPSAQQQGQALELAMSAGPISTGQQEDLQGPPVALLTGSNRGIGLEVRGVLPASWLAAAS